MQLITVSSNVINQVFRHNSLLAVNQTNASELRQLFIKVGYWRVVWIRFVDVLNLFINISKHRIMNLSASDQLNRFKLIAIQIHTSKKDSEVDFVWLIAW